MHGLFCFVLLLSIVIVIYSIINSPAGEEEKNRRRSLFENGSALLTTCPRPDEQPTTATQSVEKAGEVGAAAPLCLKLFEI